MPGETTPHPAVARDVGRLLDAHGGFMTRAKDVLTRLPGAEDDPMLAPAVRALRDEFAASHNYLQRLHAYLDERERNERAARHQARLAKKQAAA